MSRIRNACFTAWIKPNCEKCSYMCYGVEICPETKKIHYQGYVEFNEGISMAQIKKRFNDKQMHIETRRGSQSEAINYCMKDGDFHEHGKRSSQGERTDLKVVASSLLDGSKTIEDIMIEDPNTYCRYRNGLKDIAGLAVKKLTQKFRSVEVNVLWGDAGSGKTREAIENNASHFILDMGDNVWFDGYNGEECLIIDDFYGWIKYGQLLRILDGHQLRLNVKGSFTYANWSKVVITSNKPPEEWYEVGLTDALKRRLSKVTHKCSRVILTLEHEDDKNENVLFFC